VRTATLKSKRERVNALERAQRGTTATIDVLQIGAFARL
jgi:hypothetical protein